MNKPEAVQTGMALSYKYKFNAVLKQIVNNRYLLLLFLPGFIYFIIFKYGPMYGVSIAFKDFLPTEGIAGSPWVGLKHFEKMFTSMEFWMVFRNTLIISIYSIIFVFPVPIILALMLNELRSMVFKRVTQTLIYLPYFISWVIGAGLIIELLSPESGVINYIIKLFGGQPIYFITKKEYFRPILVITSIWKNAGWGTIIYMAALAGIDIEMYEAAVIDGASRFQKMIYITIPSIVNIIIIMFILRIGFILNADFEQILNLYNPLVLDVADIIDTYIYRVGLLGSISTYSYAAVVGLFKSIIGLTLIIITNKLADRFTSGEMKVW